MFDMSNAKPVSTPTAVGAQLPKFEVLLEVKFPYCEVVSLLLYAAMVTRPDIANAVSQLSQHLCAFGEEHIAAVKRVMRYLRGTIDVALEYRTDGRMNMIDYVDADHAGDQATRRSMTRYIFALNGTAVTWASKRQGIVALSICEAEYIAMAEAAKEVLWLRTFLRELGFEEGPMLVRGDNQGALKLAEREEHHRRTKHIDIRFRFLRDVDENGSIELEYVSTDDNVANALMKALFKQRFEHFRSLIGLIMRK